MEAAFSKSQVELDDRRAGVVEKGFGSGEGVATTLNQRISSRAFARK